MDSIFSIKAVISCRSAGQRTIYNDFLQALREINSISPELEVVGYENRTYRSDRVYRAVYCRRINPAALWPAVLIPANKRSQRFRALQRLNRMG